MDKSKFILKSKAIIGAIILGSRFFGFDLPFVEEEAEAIVRGALDMVGLILVIWGRVTATQPLGWVPKSLRR